MGRRPKNELNALARASRFQLQLAEELGISLRKRMQVKKDIAGSAGVGWIPDEDWRRDFASVTNTLQHAGNSLIRAMEGTKKQNGGKSEEELREQLHEQLVENATSVPEEMWQAMLAARARKGQQ